ncbi:DUF4838 domain-containing protein [Paenibacillus cymbidii]|uniref:DUF4838 domain-containing protein n=1 Tax=Paenibacillus cymbidii TaxID=1639034 RepID=UPI001081CEBE|nr:DUF4838 domain-containing protein [Paenibacillus cymbidii]
MNAIELVVPFEDAERLTPIWAEEEARIDFQREAERADRCTLAFAATELNRYLRRTLPEGTEIRYARQALADGDPQRTTIALRIAAGPGLGDDAFTLERSGQGVVITGHGRAGVLYGAYELLRLQGWRWFAPGEAGEIAPERRVSGLVLPEESRTYRPSMPQGRGFDFEYVSMESETFFLWMARNRMNIAAYRPATAAFCRKLGMGFKVGGHIFEAILDPDRPLPGGRTMWEEHAHWYGLPESGERRKEDALAIQFCVSQPDLIAFLGDELIRRLSGEWKEADRVDVWGFDTWGKSCMCAACRQLGNSADQLLHFAAGMRDEVNRAHARGELGRPVRLVLCAYEGTDTLFGPSRPVPESVLAAGDMIVYYPINRCYAHDLADAGCAANDKYRKALHSWTSLQPAVPVIVGEYYNVSKFEDLPLLFVRRMLRDIPAYARMGVRGMTYMHVPLVGWGMRTLTQLLYAQLLWDAETDGDAFLSEYFSLWYGPHAERMRQAYEAIEEAWRDIADWRAWKRDSVLSHLLRWDGGRASAPLAAGDHFGAGGPAVIVQAGRASLGLLEQAMRGLEAALADDKALSAAGVSAAWRVAVNPAEASRQTRRELRHELRLGEDRRLLRYGIDTMRLQVETVAYHTALHEGAGEAAEAAWQEMERAAERLDLHFIPLGYEQPGAGFVSKDALTRSQLREVLLRCRAKRAEAERG